MTARILFVVCVTLSKNCWYLEKIRSFTLLLG